MAHVSPDYNYSASNFVWSHHKLFTGNLTILQMLDESGHHDHAKVFPGKPVGRSAHRPHALPHMQFWQSPSLALDFKPQSFLPLRKLHARDIVITDRYCTSSLNLFFIMTSFGNPRLWNTKSLLLTRTSKRVMSEHVAFSLLCAKVHQQHSPVSSQVMAFVRKTCKMIPYASIGCPTAIVLESVTRSYPMQ